MTNNCSKLILVLESWLGRPLNQSEKMQIEEAVTNYFLMPLAKYCDRLFGKIEPNFNIYITHINNNIFNKCRYDSTLYRFNSKKNFYRWYNYYERIVKNRMNRTDITIIYELCDRYDFQSFISALDTASVKTMSYVRKILIESNLKPINNTKPAEIQKNAKKVKKDAFFDVLDECDINKRYDR